MPSGDVAAAHFSYEASESWGSVMHPTLGLRFIQYMQVAKSYRQDFIQLLDCNLVKPIFPRMAKNLFNYQHGLGILLI